MKCYCNNYDNGLHVQKELCEDNCKEEDWKDKKLSCKVVGEKLSVNLLGNRFLLLWWT